MNDFANTNMDIYVLSKKRDKVSIELFLNKYLPQREECAEDYAIPQFSQSPEILFSRDHELIEYCEKNTHIKHAIYWWGLDNGTLHRAMVFFLMDGCIVYGLSTSGNNMEFPKKVLQDLKNYLGSNHGYITYEEPPYADNYNEFLEQEKLYQIS